MATLQDLRNWIERDLGRFAPIDEHVEVVSWHQRVTEPGPREPICVAEAHVKIYTDINRYSIHAREGIDDTGYLGCTSSSRKSRAGEDWHRGSDLADGPFHKGTWHRILADIVSYEMVRVHVPKQQPAQDVPAMGPIVDTEEGPSIEADTCQTPSSPSAPA